MIIMFNFGSTTLYIIIIRKKKICSILRIKSCKINRKLTLLIDVGNPKLRYHHLSLFQKIKFWIS